jgi:hypothetical protein
LEESGKLVPLLVLVVVAPGRVRRFATVDWALVGFVSGAAFNAYEDALRQIAVQQSWFFWGVSGKTYTLNPWASGRFVTTDGFAVSPGHHIWTAMTAMSTGLAIAWWRAGRRGSRVGACVLPVVTVLLAIAEHASYNAYNTTSSWPEQTGAGFSSILSGLWSVTGHGRASTVVSVLLLLACLAVDVHRRHQAALLSPANGPGRGCRGHRTRVAGGCLVAGAHRTARCGTDPATPPGCPSRRTSTRRRRDPGDPGRESMVGRRRGHLRRPHSHRSGVPP